MRIKKIVNIVFYKYYQDGKEQRKTCIFYNDGTVENVSYEEGIDACQEIVKERHITSKEAFKELINNDIIHVVSGNDFVKNFRNYVVKEEIEDKLNNVENDNLISSLENLEEESKNNYDDYETIEEEESEDEDEFEEDLEHPLKFSTDGNNLDGYSFVDYDNDNTNKNEASDSDESEDDEDYEEYEDEDEDSDEIEDDDFDEDEFEEYEDDDIDEIEADNYDEDIEDIEDFEEENEAPKERKGLLGLIQRGFEKIKKSKLVKRITLCVTAIAIFFGGYTCGARKTKEGVMHNSNITSEASNNAISTIKFGKGSKTKTLIKGNNDFYNDYTVKELLKVTDNKTQKTAMKNLNKTINNYNGVFANAFLEEGKDVRAALTFDEIVAIQQAYNDYNKNEIKSYFNGEEITAADMEKDYKSATLQLMGAHVIETRENQVDMSNLLKDEDAKEFYKKFHEMFLAAKEATGDEKIAKVNAFRKEIRNEFPITQKIRTEGIMHADAYNSIESYKLSVIPMIAASEMMFQNLETDYTLNDSEIDFLNDIGLCNYAQDKFERIETITLSSEEDNTNPLYEQYRNASIKALKAKDKYVTNDARRDLSRLDTFQKQINWHFELDKNGHYTGKVYYTTKNSTTTKTWTTKKTSRKEETTTKEKEIPASEKEKIDKETEKENEQAKVEGEKDAEETREEMQKDADKDAEKIKEEIENDDEDLQNKIGDANDKINDNNKDDDKSNDTSVNEDDFGDHNVDFDDNHSNDNGDLNDSVENITTDGTGDQTNEKMPDPNETGAEFDKQAGSDKQEKSSRNNNKNEASENKVQEKSASSVKQTIIEYEEPAKSNDQLVDEYVESLANQGDKSNESHEYSK